MKTQKVLKIGTIQKWVTDAKRKGDIAETVVIGLIYRAERHANKPAKSRP